MSEDVSATMRVGITVILVAALVATVLNLMVMSNSLLSGGQTTLQSGIDSVSTQEFAAYDNTKVSGTQVNTAMNLFQGRDIAVIIQTKSVATCTDDGITKGNMALNYGACLTSDGATSNGTTNAPHIMAKDSSDVPTGWKSVTANTSIITEQARTAVVVDISKAMKMGSGDAWYTANLHNNNGLVDSSYDIIGTTILGNYAYLLSSSRFSSQLIKDSNGSIIGIFFKQLN